jgi:nucleotide-binding universal stress UspA family protein
VNILVPVDGSAPALHAVDAAVDLAGVLHAQIAVCSVVSLAEVALASGGNAQLLGGCLQQFQQKAADAVGEARERIGERAPVICLTPQGETADEIVRTAAKLPAAMIVMGSHGRTGLSRAVVGSVAEEVLRHATVPVMVVPFRGTARPA